MKLLMITWTDIFEGTADFFQIIFKGMKVLGQAPNVFIWLLVGFGISYWTMRLFRYRKESNRNSTVE